MMVFDELSIRKAPLLTDHISEQGGYSFDCVSSHQPTLLITDRDGGKWELAEGTGKGYGYCLNPIGGFSAYFFSNSARVDHKTLCLDFGNISLVDHEVHAVKEFIGGPNGRG